MKYISCFQFKNKWIVLTLLTVTLFPNIILAEDVIGSETLKRISQGAGIQDTTKEEISTMISWLKVLLSIVAVLTFTVIALVSKVTNFQLFPKWKSNSINGSLMPIFALLFFGGIFYEFFHHRDHYLNYSASEHAERIDPIFMTTALMTGIVFIVTQLLLFIFSFKYKGDSDDKTPFWKKKIALHYADNEKLEKIWTLIPAVGMAILVFWGAIVWTSVHDEAPKEAINIEVVAEQFQWTVRHSGKDNILAKADYRKIGGGNILGVNYKDPAAADDIVLAEKEIHIPVGTPINFQIRSKDVLHGFYTPQLKAHIYAVPGMPTHFLVTPTKTTEEMRKQLNKPDFNYEVACSQLCGSAHYNMRLIIVVHTKEEYKQWLEKQKPTFTPEKIAQLDEEAKENQKNIKKI
jgi:cytochrome c oxidase subunit 2